MGVPGDARTWAYRRDPSLTAPREQMVGTTEDGIRHLRPEAVLLFKAKHQRPKDEADFATATARMDATQRAWLHDALTREHPGHDWLARLQP